MTAPQAILAYAPDQMPMETVLEITVGRESLLKDLFEAVNAHEKSLSRQHQLIIGPRGMGKTHLLKLLQHRVENELGGHWVISRFREEEPSIASYLDFLDRVVERITAQDVRDRLQEAREAAKRMESEHSAANILMTSIRDACRERQARLLVLVENLNDLLDNQLRGRDERHGLRDLLMRENWILLIGTTPARFAHITGPSHEFFGFFRTLELDELGGDECLELLKKGAAVIGRKDIVEMIEKEPFSARAVLELTGGYPRAVILLLSVLARAPGPDVATQLLETLDWLTPYYKSLIEVLPANERRVLDSVMRARTASSGATEIAEGMGRGRVSPQTVSQYIRRLVSKGHLRPKNTETSDARTSRYEPADPIFYLWYKMRYDPKATRRLGFLAEFLVALMRILSKKTAGKYIQKGLDESIKGMKRAVERRDKQAARSLLDWLELFTDARTALSPKLETRVKDCVTLMKAKLKLEDLPSARAEAESFIKSILKTHPDALPDVHFRIAEVYREAARAKGHDEVLSRCAFDHYANVVQKSPKDHLVWAIWGNAIAELAKAKGNDENLYLEANLKYAKAAEIKPDDPNVLFYWGINLHTLAGLKGSNKGLYQDAAKKFAKAVEKQPDYSNAWIAWGITLRTMGWTREDNIALYHQAMKKFAKAVKIKSDDEFAYLLWGDTLSTIARLKGDDENLYQEAIKKYAKAVKIKPNYLNAWSNWGDVLHVLGSNKGHDEHLYREAIKRYAKAVKIKPNSFDDWLSWGIALLQIALKKGDGETLYKRANEKFSKAIAITPGDPDAWHLWGLSFTAHAIVKKNDKHLYQQAFNKYAKAVEINPDMHDVWYSWGAALSRMSRAQSGLQRQVSQGESLNRFLSGGPPPDEGSKSALLGLFIDILSDDNWSLILERWEEIKNRIGDEHLEPVYHAARHLSGEKGVLESLDPALLKVVKQVLKAVKMEKQGR